MAGAFDWKSFEGELYEELRHALASAGRKHRAERFHAVALHGVDRELDGLLSLPLLGAALEAGAPPPDDQGFWGARYNPADWQLPEIDLRKRPALRLERALTAEATRGSQIHWRKVEARYFKVLVRLTRRLRDEAPSLLTTSGNFVVFWHDEEGGPDLAARTIPRALYERLFARQVDDARKRRAAAEMPAGERSAFLVTRFGVYEGVTSEDAQRELLALGEAALPALTGTLTDPKHAWTAAKVIGQIGIATPEIIEALRARGDELWFAMALGMLGDHDWLASRSPAVAAQGLCARLKAITAGGPPRPLDYAPLERYLDAAGEGARARVEEELEPGSSYAAISGDDVDEALRGLDSPHAVVRWHAASTLGHRGLGAAAGKRILPALARLLTDPHPVVRRLAVLSISYWKAAARPYRPSIEALRDDPDEVVRRIVEHVLR